MRCIVHEDGQAKLAASNVPVTKAGMATISGRFYQPGGSQARQGNAHAVFMNAEQGATGHDYACGDLSLAVMTINIDLPEFA